MIEPLCILLVVALLGVVCIWLSDRAGYSEKVQSMESDRDDLRGKLSLAEEKIGQLIGGTGAFLDRLRKDNLDLRCKLELIDEEVGFWVNDKMEVRWGAKGCCVDPIKADVTSFSDDLPSFLDVSLDLHEVDSCE